MSEYPAYFELDITVENIAKGHPGDNGNCPIAWALQDFFSDTWAEVAHEVTLIRHVPYPPDEAGDEPWEEAFAKPPLGEARYTIDAATDIFIKEFDAGRFVAPQRLKFALEGEA